MNITSNRLQNWFRQHNMLDDEGRVYDIIIQPNTISPQISYAFDNIYLSFEEIEQLNILKPDAVLLLHKKPFILFYDLQQNDAREDDLHTKSWNYNKAPLVIVWGKNDTPIVYNAFSLDNKKGVLEVIDMQNEDNNYFSFWNIVSGKTWDWYQQDKIKHGKNRVYNVLFNNIKNLRDAISPSEKDESEAAKTPRQNKLLF